MPVPPFIADLRSYVGSQLLWLSGVSAVVVDEANRVLLVRRSDNGLWSIVSGILEPGEQPAPAIIREVYEETGVHVVPERISTVYTEPPMVYPNGDQAQYLDIAFRCRPVGGIARVNDDESFEVAWFAADKLPDLDEKNRLKISRALEDHSEPWFVEP
jgi:8-oxo-dGTP pyrophosphatase MutT (NUDIX family)